MGRACGMFVGGRRGAYGVLVKGNMKERVHTEEPSVDGMIIIKWFLNRLEMHILD